MVINVIMPQLGESIVEGTINKWLVQEGDEIKEMAPMLEVGSDKVDTDVPSPADGVILKLYAAEGETLAVGTLIAAIGQAGEAAPDAEETTPSVSVEAPLRASAPAPPADSGQDLGFVSPVVARLAAEHNIDLKQVVGTGLKGRIRKKDVLAHIEQSGAEGSPKPPLDVGGRLEGGERLPYEIDDPIAEQPASGDQIVPLSRMRRLIAEHMVQSKRTSPHVATVFDCDLTAVVKHRYAHKDAFARDGANLTFTPYFVAAIVSALKLHPLANSAWSDEGIVLKRAINVGMATAIDDGLVVPVIKNADSLNLLGLTRTINDLAQRARADQLKPDELQSGTFTLTNHGTSGSLFAMPIINQPQTGILGVGKIHKAPVVISQGHPLLPDATDAIAIRPIAYLSFTFDHRVLDGAMADAFVSTVKRVLERWEI